MIHQRRALGALVLLLLVIGLAACGGDKPAGSSAGAATPTAATGGGLPAGAPLLGVAPGGGNTMPGCSDPNDEECPAALALPLDGLASANGVTLNYPNGFFQATITPRAADGVLIRITPSAANKYAEQASFEVRYAESVAAALAPLDAPETVDWSTPAYTGKIGVSKATTVEPPVTTVIGALELPDGRAVVLKAITTGKYGWDLWHKVYEDMFNSIQVTG